MQADKIAEFNANWLETLSGIMDTRLFSRKLFLLPTELNESSDKSDDGRERKKLSLPTPTIIASIENVS